MTIIASFSIQEYPILFGDLLLSGDEDLNTTMQTPSFGEISKIFPKGSGYVPCGLNQKITVVNEHLAVAWSGTRLYAQVIINELIHEARKKEFWTLEDLSSFFSNYDEEHGDKVSIVGFSNDGKCIFSFGYGSKCMKYKSDQYGLVRLAGSGAPDLKNYLEHLDIPYPSGVVNPLERAVSKTLAITTYMKGIETISGKNLLQYYGGGFEILSYVRKKFKKIDDVTYLIWDGRQVGNTSWELNLPRIAIKYSYHGDVLVIRKSEFHPLSKSSLRCENNALHVVSPIYREITNRELKNIKPASLDSKFICSFINLFYRDGSIKILNRINYSGQKENPIRFRKDSKEKMYMDIRSDFLESIFKGLYAEQ